MDATTICLGLYVISCIFSGLYTMSTGCGPILTTLSFFISPIGIIGFIVRHTPASL